MRELVAIVLAAALLLGGVWIDGILERRRDAARDLVLREAARHRR